MIAPLEELHLHPYVALEPPWTGGAAGFAQANGEFVAFARTQRCQPECFARPDRPSIFPPELQRDMVWRALRQRKPVRLPRQRIPRQPETHLREQAIRITTGSHTHAEDEI